MSNPLTEQDFIKRFGELRAAFALCDTDNDNLISAKELMNVMKSLGQNPTQEEVRIMIDEIDADGNKQIDFPEFVTCLTRLKDYDELYIKKPDNDQQKAFDARKKEMEENELKRAFDDISQGNVLDIKKFRDKLSELGVDVSSETLLKLIRDADLDGDEQISFDEFKAMIESDFWVKENKKKKH